MLLHPHPHPDPQPGVVLQEEGRARRGPLAQEVLPQGGHPWDQVGLRLSKAPSDSQSPPFLPLSLSSHPPPGTRSLIKNPAERADLKMLMVSDTQILKIQGSLAGPPCPK